MDNNTDNIKSTTKNKNEATRSVSYIVPRHTPMGDNEAKAKAKYLARISETIQVLSQDFPDGLSDFYRFVFGIRNSSMIFTFRASSFFNFKKVMVKPGL